MTLNELRKGIDEYFKRCEEEGVFPDEAGMSLFLGAPRETLEKWLAGSPESGFRRAVSDARLRRESLLVRGIYASEKAATGKIFLSKQGSHGALGSRPGAERSAGVEVKLSGMKDGFD